MVAVPRLPRLKYCGLTRVEDVLGAIDCGADAIGLNFYPDSPRCISSDTARRLSSAINHRAMVVGVFVNASVEAVADMVDRCRLDCVQLHGDESPEWVEQASSDSALKTKSFIKAIAWRDTDRDRHEAQRWSQYDNPCVLGLLVDAFDPVQRGGTGRTARWDLLSPRPIEFGGLSILLAGGLTEHNVSEAIRMAKPDGIDLASGIESEPGVKELLKMQAISKIAIPLLS